MITKHLVIKTPSELTPIQAAYDDIHNELSMSVVKGNRTTHYAWCPPDDNVLKPIYEYIKEHFNSIENYTCIIVNDKNEVTGTENAETFFGKSYPNIDKDPYEDWRKLIHN